MDSNNYLVDNIFDNIKLVMKEKGKFIVIFFIIQIFLNIILYLIFNDSLTSYITQIQDNLKNGTSKEIIEKVFNVTFLLFGLLTYLITVLIAGLIVHTAFKTIINPEDKNHRRNIIRKYISFILMDVLYFLLLFFVLIGYFFICIIFSIMPILMILVALFLGIGIIIFVFYYSGYYRFVSYIGFFEGTTETFKKSKRYIKGHLGLSIFMMIISGLLSMILSIFIKDDNHFSTYIITEIFTSGIVFFFTLFDITFIITGYKNIYYNDNNEKIIDPLTRDFSVYQMTDYKD